MTIEMTPSSTAHGSAWVVTYDDVISTVYESLHHEKMCLICIVAP